MRNQIAFIFGIIEVREAKNDEGLGLEFKGIGTDGCEEGKQKKCEKNGGEESFLLDGI